VIAENDMKETAQQYTQRMLAYMDGKQWTHYGQHSERGQESIGHIVRMFAAHDINHLQQIAEILGEPGVEPGS